MVSAINPPNTDSSTQPERIFPPKLPKSAWPNWATKAVLEAMRCNGTTERKAKLSNR